MPTIVTGSSIGFANLLSSGQSAMRNTMQPREYSVAQRARVFVTWFEVFYQHPNYMLRRLPAIQAFMEKNHAAALIDEPDLVPILQSLLRDNLFSETQVALLAHPELNDAICDVNMYLDMSVLVPDVARAESKEKLLSSLDEMYRTAENSDVTIKCDGVKYHVHSSIMSQRSEYFSMAIRSKGFKKAKGMRISLKHDPTAVKIMVWYCYHFDYKLNGDPKTETQNALELLQARKLLTPKELVTHVRVYNLAEKYRINGLRKIAVERFRIAAFHFWNTPQFLEAVEIIYNTKTRGGIGLRDLVLDVFKEHPQMLNDVMTMVFLLKPNMNVLTFDLLMASRKND